MGKNEFYQWVDQLWREKSKEQAQGDSWRASEHDARWQSMRGKREKARGR